MFLLGELCAKSRKELLGNSQNIAPFPASSLHEPRESWALYLSLPTLSGADYAIVCKHSVLRFLCGPIIVGLCEASFFRFCICRKQRFLSGTVVFQALPRGEVDGPIRRRYDDV